MTHPRLRDVYQRIASRVGTSWSVEPLESVETVFRHRKFWQPDELRVLLLAESHVETTAKELRNRVDLIPFGVFGSPPEYARFVYCLGYGEDQLVQGKVEKNAGTPQFWRLFYSCVHEVGKHTDFSPVYKGGERNLGRRIANKLAVLQEMRRRGIWLVDVSVIALYRPVGKAKGADPLEKLPQNKAPRDVMEIATQESWRGFWQAEISALAPRHILCIGRDVQRFLGDALARQFPGRVTVIEQPNAWLKSDHHLRNLETCSRICAEFAPA